MCLCWVSVFGVVPFFSYSPPKFTEATEKSIFGEKRPVSRKFQNFATKGFIGKRIHVFLPSFVKISKAEVTTWVLGIHDEKMLFCPFLCGFWSNLNKNFTVSLFPHSPSLCQVLSKSVSFQGDISKNVFQTHYNIGLKPVGFSSTIKTKTSV